MAPLWSPSRGEVGIDGRSLHHVLPAEDGHQWESFIQHADGELKKGRSCGAGPETPPNTLKGHEGCCRLHGGGGGRRDSCKALPGARGGNN